MTESKGREILSLLSVAKVALANATESKEAYHRFCINPFGPMRIEHEQVFAKERKFCLLYGKWERKRLKNILKRIEILNGELFVAGLPTFPLKDYFLGGGIKLRWEWKERESVEEAWEQRLCD